MSGGRFALTWSSGVDSAGDVSGDLVYGQLFNADSSMSGSRFQVNTISTGSQYQNAMTTLADGRFLVSWTDASQSPDDASGTAVRGQIFDPREAGVTFAGNALANQFHGTSFDDRIDGAGGADILGGGGGDDRIDGGDGADAMTGGAGNDIFMVDNVADQVNESPGEGAADSVYAAVSGYTLAANVEVGYLLLPGGTLWAHDGGATLFGTDGNDSLYGGAGHDYFAGLGGDDRIDGGGGVDDMTGGTGNDIYIVDNVADHVTEGAGEGGADSIYAAVSGYMLAANVEIGYLILPGGALWAHDGGATLFGTDGNDSLNGGAGIDYFGGQGGDDRIDGGGGADHMTGGAGNDIYMVDNIAEHVTEGTGEGAADSAYAAVSGYTLAANVEIGYLLLPGGALWAHDGGATLFGTEGNDSLYGGAGIDYFGGQGGNDCIDGGGDTDHMTGGAGNDIYMVDNVADHVTEGRRGGHRGFDLRHGERLHAREQCRGRPPCYRAGRCGLMTAAPRCSAPTATTSCLAASARGFCRAGAAAITSTAAAATTP